MLPNFKSPNSINPLLNYVFLVFLVKISQMSKIKN